MNPNMICPWCGKMSHATRTTALRVGRRLAGRVRLRVYRCPVGQGWHLTSRRPRRRQAAVRRPPRDGRPRNRAGQLR